MPGSKKKHRKKKSKSGVVKGKVESRSDDLSSSNSSASSIEELKQDGSAADLPPDFLVLPLPEGKKAQDETAREIEAQISQAEAQIAQAQEALSKGPVFNVGNDCHAVVFAAMVSDKPEDLPEFYRKKPEEYTFTRKGEPMNLLHISAYFGAVDMAKWLISTKVFDLDELTCNGKSAIWFAIRYDDEPLVSFKTLLHEQNNAWVERKAAVFRLLLENGANADIESIDGIGGLWDVLFELNDDLHKNGLRLDFDNFIEPLINWDEKNFDKPTILQHGFNSPHDFHYKRLLFLTDEGLISFTDKSLLSLTDGFYGYLKPRFMLLPRIMEIISNKLSVFDLEAETNVTEMNRLKEVIKDLEKSLNKSKELSKSSAQSMSDVLLLEDKLEKSQKACKELTSKLKTKDKELGKKGKITAEYTELQASFIKAQQEIEEFKTSLKTSVTKADFDKFKVESETSIKDLEGQLSQFRTANKDLLQERSELFSLRDRQSSSIEKLVQKNKDLSCEISKKENQNKRLDILLKEALSANRALRAKASKLDVLAKDNKSLREEVSKLSSRASSLTKAASASICKSETSFIDKERELMQQISCRDEFISSQQQQLQESQYKDQIIFDLISQLQFVASDLQEVTSERDAAQYSASQAQIFADSLGQQLGDLTRSSSSSSNSSIVELDRKYQAQLSDLRGELSRTKADLSVAKFNLSKGQKPESSGAGAGSFVMAQASGEASGVVVEAGV